MVLEIMMFAAAIAHGIPNVESEQLRALEQCLVYDKHFISVKYNKLA